MAFFKNLQTFFTASYEELVHKVTWLKWGTLQRQAILVIVASTLFAVIIGGVIDKSFEYILRIFYGSN